MKTLTLLTALLAAVLVASCGKPGDRYGSTTYRIPWPSATGALSLQNVEIRTLSDPEHLSGASAQILVEPGDGGSTLQGARPVGRYVKTSSGVLVPADYVTMQGVTAYAHQERLHDLDTLTGAVSFLSWPLSIGIDVHVVSDGQRATNNAIYDAKLNSLLLVPYDEGELPIALNPGISAHEHFHFIFQKIVMSRVRDAASQTSCNGGVARLGDLPIADSGFSSGPSDFVGSRESVNGAAAEKMLSNQSENEAKLVKTAAGILPRTFNAFVLRGMNEGFADFYGWLYSHDDSFLAKSIPDQDEMRRLDRHSGRLPAEGLIRRLLVDNFHPDSILPDVVRAHNAYSLGSIYARFLRQLASQLEAGGLSAEDSRLTVARALISSLPTIADSVASIYDTGFLSPNIFLKPLLAQLPSLSKESCALVASFHAPDISFETPDACHAFDLTPKPIVKTAPAPASPAVEKPSSKVDRQDVNK
jgi:hypothetical protein